MAHQTSTNHDTHTDDTKNVQRNIEAAKLAAQQERNAKNLRESMRECRVAAEYIREHLILGGGGLLPYKLFVENSLTPDLLEKQKDGSFSEMGKKFYRALSELGIEKENVSIQKLVKQTPRDDAGIITIEIPSTSS